MVTPSVPITSLKVTVKVSTAVSAPSVQARDETVGALVSKLSTSTVAEAVPAPMAFPAISNTLVVLTVTLNTPRAATSVCCDWSGMVSSTVSFAPALATTEVVTARFVVPATASSSQTIV